MEIKYTPKRNFETKLNHSGPVTYITFPALEAYSEITHAFSTREGGVSRGMFSSMNLGKPDVDSPENVMENFNRLCAAAGIDVHDLVISDQKHTTNIRVATAADRGKGLFLPRDYSVVDGFITNEPNVALCLLYADCVPIFLYDPVHQAIGLVHSGWKGTRGRIGAEALGMLKENYGTRPEDVICVIAPSICRDCYEVSSDLYDAFSETFSKDDLDELFLPGKPGKYQLDLWEANCRVLLQAGAKEEHIHVTDLCTCCNPGLLFSHRASHGKRGNLAALFMLR